MLRVLARCAFWSYTGLCVDKLLVWMRGCRLGYWVHGWLGRHTFRRYCSPLPGWRSANSKPVQVQGRAGVLRRHRRVCMMSLGVCWAFLRTQPALLPASSPTLCTPKLLFNWLCFTAACTLPPHQTPSHQHNPPPPPTTSSIDTTQACLMATCCAACATTQAARPPTPSSCAIRWAGSNAVGGLGGRLDGWVGEHNGMRCGHVRI